MFNPRYDDDEKKQIKMTSISTMMTSDGHNKDGKGELKTDTSQTPRGMFFSFHDNV
jgi:hypothetical protein